MPTGSPQGWRVKKRSTARKGTAVPSFVSADTHHGQVQPVLAMHCSERRYTAVKKMWDIWNNYHLSIILCFESYRIQLYGKDSCLAGLFFSVAGCLVSLVSLRLYLPQDSADQGQICYCWCRWLLLAEIVQMVHLKKWLYLLCQKKRIFPRKIRRPNARNAPHDNERARQFIGWPYQS